LRPRKSQDTDKPEWLQKSDELFQPVWKALWSSIQNNELSLQLNPLPIEALRFIVYSLGYSDDANRNGRHAICMAMLRQSVEAISVVELGLTRHASREKQLQLWQDRKCSPGALRGWLEKNTWKTYGPGIWNESWAQFMGHFAKSVQPYAHFSPDLILWQEAFFGFSPGRGGWQGMAMTGNDCYDPQKASRITLFHSILFYVLARLLVENSSGARQDLKNDVASFGDALGRSEYLFGNRTNWEHAFLGMMWRKDGSTLFE